MDIYEWILFIGSTFTVLISLVYLFLCWKKRLYWASIIAFSGAINLLASGIVRLIRGDKLDDILFTGFCMLLWFGVYAMTAWSYRKNLE
jgi:hypothetical protein